MRAQSQGHPAANTLAGSFWFGYQATSSLKIIRRETFPAKAPTSSLHSKGSSFSNTYTLLAPRRTDRERTHKSRSPAKHFASLTNARQVFNELLTTALLMTHGKVQGQVHLAGRSSAKVARRGPEEGPLLFPHCVHQCACMSEQIGEHHSSSQNCDVLTANYKRPMRKLHRKRRS